MAGSLGAGKKPIASINMTPLVDIMLVLLIVFMIATQAVDSASVPVKLPKASSAGSSAPSAVLVHLDASGALRLDGRSVDRPGLRQFLSQRASRDTSLQVVLAADETLAYARVMAVLDDVRGAGVTRYALKVRVGEGP
jgi:biopolymer transport protein TolR